MKKLLLYLTCFILILGCLNTTVFAAGGMSTYANNLASTKTQFSINSNGVATVRVGYSGYEGITTNAVIKTKIQKSFLFFFWQDVEGASWTDNATGSSYLNTHSITVSSGTYKVVVEYKVYGSGGSADTITDELEATR